jgi:hypothetical protein
MRDFESLIAPIRLDEFNALYWQKMAFIRRTQEPVGAYDSSLRLHLMVR